MAKSLKNLGCQLFATEGTQGYLAEKGIEAVAVRKINEESPNILDLLKNREVDLLVNTPTKANDAQRDGFKIRRTAIEYGVEVLTSIDTLNAIIKVQELNVDKMDLDIFDIAQI